MSDNTEPSAPKRTPFIATAPARATLVPLEQGLGARGPFVLLMGDPGTGRSMLAREALRRRGDRIVPVLLPDPAPPPADLLATLLVLFGGGPPKPGAMAFALTERLMDTLANVTAAGRVAVALIDDAERLTDEHFLELHRITALAAQRQCPFELLLVGTPKLLDRFDAPHMATVRPRISVRATLGRFSPNDTREYLQSRLNASGVPCTGMFSRKASRDIHQVTVGTVRLIETLAAESLRRATRAGQGTVSPEHVRAAEHALRTGRPSDVFSAPTASQIRAADVSMGANSRSVAAPATPTPAPSQGMQPMGAQARQSDAHANTPAGDPAATAPGTPRPAPQPAQHNKHGKPFRPGKHGAHGNAPHAQRDASAHATRAQAAPIAPAQAGTSTSNPGAPPADATRPTNNPAPAQSGANPSVPAPQANTPTPSGTHARVASKPARDPGSIGDYPSSDDPRVQEWLARFGGKGVRVGGSYPTASTPQDYADFGSNRMADADGVVTPARPIRRSPEPGVTQASSPAAHVASTPSGGSQPPVAEPHVTHSQPPAAASPVAPSAPSQPAAPAITPAASTPASHAPAANAQPAPAGMPGANKPVHSGKHGKHKNKRGHTPVPSTPAASTPTPVPSAPAPARSAVEPVVSTPGVARIERHVPGRTATRSAAAPSTHRPNAGSALLVAGVIVAALAAIGVSQRHALQSMFTQALAETASHKAVTSVATPPPAPAPPPVPPAQYGIAVGSYPTRDMASAECDYLSRLVPVRVRVNALGGDRGYRLLLGRFDDRDSAELATQRMQGQGLIPDARVIELTPLPGNVSPVDTLTSTQPESTARETTVRDTPRSEKRPHRRAR